ncbi:Outer membrane lipoprotein-sorting protein [Cohaesibacter sp. ES.047]|uniref:LolA family protein n=1 Tax=Cohaesibacter sp. ES.047 TaxID=1798205 RepID=UPI000BB803BB|nr:outer-membrane lipoprotein carrier protein LolA [Cohaesibacter sp. ES.047]SNY90635.1 Outer membrane lipoprotein-sorting protein [Cohaesibacter sp. ES.047]
MQTPSRSKALAKSRAEQQARFLPLMLGSLLLVLALLVASAANAMTNDEKKALDKISKDFNTTKTMNGEFIQTAPNGDTLQGYFFIERPGKIRFYYSKPSYTDIISDGKTLSIEDRKLKTQDIYPLSKTPLRVLLSDNLNLSTDSRVKQAVVADDIISVVVEQESLFGDGILTLIFDRETSLLRQWTIIDANNNETTVTVFNVESGRPIKQSLFKIKYDVGPGSRN